MLTAAHLFDISPEFGFYRFSRDAASPQTFPSVKDLQALQTQQEYDSFRDRFEGKHGRTAVTRTLPSHRYSGLRKV